MLEFTHEDVMERKTYVLETLKASGVSRNEGIVDIFATRPWSDVLLAAFSA